MGGGNGGMQDEGPGLTRMPGCLATSDIESEARASMGLFARSSAARPLAAATYHHHFRDGSPVLLRFKQVENHYLDPATYLYTS